MLVIKNNRASYFRWKSYLKVSNILKLTLLEMKINIQRFVGILKNRF